MKKSKFAESYGFTLVEMLVVISVFSILGILITRSILLTLGGGKKSESLINVRDNLNYSVGVMERLLRNADSIVYCSNANTSQILYKDQNGNATSFSCVNVGASGKVGYIASGSSQLSDPAVNVTNCSFVCNPGVTIPSSVTVNLTGQDASASGVQNSSVTIQTQILLRNY